MYDIEDLEFSEKSAKCIIGSYVVMVSYLLNYAYW